MKKQPSAKCGMRLAQAKVQRTPRYDNQVISRSGIIRKDKRLGKKKWL